MRLRMGKDLTTDKVSEAEERGMGQVTKQKQCRHCCVYILRSLTKACCYCQGLRARIEVLEEQLTDNAKTYAAEISALKFRLMQHNVSEISDEDSAEEEDEDDDDIDLDTDKTAEVENDEDEEYDEEEEEDEEDDDDGEYESEETE